MANQDNARKLLERLAQDDAFRAQMESDPITALAEHGFKVDPSIAPSKVQLPSKDEITSNIDLLSKQLEATSGWVIFCR
ncbi:NHLP-related RiPP peptide [Novilysobacter erysipheiresistens]|uniref:NHLP-related RiPP peptide n=1 Tax=Novilysobacter erysipheiresistens TaxID=1749332 RepID=A0ABU7YYD6_9GAMM